MSLYFSQNQLKGLSKLGDVVIPGDKDLPRFSQTGFIQHIDRMVKYLPKEDLDGLKLLMGAFSYTPSFIIKFILMIADNENKMPHALGTPFRLIKLGLKGMIFTLYYSKLEDQQKSTEQIMKTLEYETNITLEECPMTENPTISKKNLDNPNLADIALIYADAKKAKADIGKLSVEQRLSLISKLKKIILEEKELIISKIQDDTNKSRSDALISEIFGVVDYLTFLEKESQKALKDESVKTPIALMGKKSKIYFESLGTMLVISPWNYPFYQAIVPIATSFVCANGTLYKPSEFTPLKGLVEDLLKKAGFEDHWVQVIYGDGLVGKNLIDGKPNKIFFTGSVATGKKIMAQAAQYLIPVELELGGKDPAIVFEDATLSRAVPGILWGALTNSGQSCTSVERIYVHEKVYDQFKELMFDQAKRVKHVVDEDGDSDMGFMTTKAQAQIIKEQIEDAQQKGATIHQFSEWDGQSLEIPVTIIEDITSSMKVSFEESFGPLLCLYKFNDEHEAIRLSNDSEFGLSASVWSKDKERCVRVARALDVGNVSINNVMLTEGNAYLPFGGRKHSGIGFYKGIYGLKAFCAMKSVIIDSDSKKIEANWYPYTKKRYGLFSRMTEGLFAGSIKGFISFALNGLKLESYAGKAKRK